MNRIETTLSLMTPGKVNCAQAILQAFGNEFGIDSTSAMALGRPWGGGLASSGGLCGFLAGAMLVLAKAFDQSEEARARESVSRAVQLLLRRFQERCHSLQCRDLLDADMSTESGRQIIGAEKRIAQRCPLFGRAAAEILEQLLEPARF